MQLINSLVEALVRAQQSAGLSNRRLAAILECNASSITHYRQGESTPSLSMAARWAEACGATLAVIEPRIAAVSELTGLAEELTPDELAALYRAARALRISRDVPTKRAVVAAALSVVILQLDDVPADLSRLLKT